MRLFNLFQRKPAVDSPKYRVGQVWAYRTRPGEESSNLYIVRVSSSGKGGDVYSIYLDGLSLKNPYVEGGIQHIMPHSPLTAESLDSSVTSLISEWTREPEGFAEAYEEWRTEFDNQRAGAFILPVAQILQMIEDSVSGSTQG